MAELKVDGVTSKSVSLKTRNKCIGFNATVDTEDITVYYVVESYYLAGATEVHVSTSETRSYKADWANWETVISEGVMPEMAKEVPGE
jgi:quinol monooxygenase YgiN